MAFPDGRWAWAEVDRSAIEHNVRLVATAAAPAALWAVVKADGYGHGATVVATAALSAGAVGLCVALAEEGAALRAAGLDAPILLLSEQPPDQVATAIRHGLTPTVYTEAGLAAVERAAQGSNGGQVGVHVKVDTGMQRVGVDPDDTVELIRALAARPGLRFDGLYTHLACADDPVSPATDEQLTRFGKVLDALDQSGLTPPVVHAANSAGALAVPGSHFDVVRAGIALYGISPAPELDHLVGGLRPALAVKARVSLVKPVVAGSHVAYGWRHRFDHDTTLATVPIGYADGVPRRLGTCDGRPGHDVLIGGRRCPIVGVVTMDQLMVDVGHLTSTGRHVLVGDEVVLIGAQGEERIRAEDWAARLGTIGYEIVCGISKRVARIERRIP